jgi:hypothetical protein
MHKSSRENRSPTSCLEVTPSVWGVGAGHAIWSVPLIWNLRWLPGRAVLVTPTHPPSLIFEIRDLEESAVILDSSPISRAATLAILGERS